VNIPFAMGAFSLYLLVSVLSAAAWWVYALLGIAVLNGLVMVVYLSKTRLKSAMY